MIIKYPKDFKVFIWLYFVTMSILLLDCLDNFPMGGVLRKIKYLYILIMFAVLIYRGYVNLRLFIACIPIFILSVFGILYGIFFTNETVILATREHVKECFMFYIFVLVTFWYVANTHCFLLYVELSYLALLFQLGFAAITHFGDFVNPIYYIYAFNESARIRTTFGFVQYNYAGNYAYGALALSMILLHSFWGISKYKKACYFILFCDFPVLCIAFSTASRSTLIAFSLTCFFYFYFEYFRKTPKASYKLLLSFAFIGIMIFLISYCIIHGTRDLNVVGNREAFEKVGNFWTGMGYVENHNFQESICIYGVKTTSLDVSYVYYYYATGFIGCIFVILTAVIFLFMLLKSKQNKYRNIVLAIYIAMLFYAYWQVNLFTYTYYTNYIYLVLYMTVFADGVIPPGKEPLVEFLV